MDQRTKRALWVVAGAVVLIALVAHHNITQQEIIIFCVIVPSIILHEVSHGWVANAFGDDTAKRAGRLSLNPLVHIDPIGTLLVPALLSLGGVGFFGWAKPVPVNVGRLRHPRNQGVVVSLAGPAIERGARRHLRRRLRAVRGRATSSGNLDGGDPVLRQPGERRALRVQPHPDTAARRLGVVRAAAPARWWPGYLRYRQYTMPILMGLVLLNFFLYPHGPITWLFDHLYNWWAGVLASEPRRHSVGGSNPMASAARAYVVVATSWALRRAACQDRVDVAEVVLERGASFAGSGRSNSTSAAATSFLRSP